MVQTLKWMEVAHGGIHWWSCLNLT